MRSRLLTVALLLCCVVAPARAHADDDDGAAVAQTAARDDGTQLIVPMQSGAFVVIRTESTPNGAEATGGLLESEEKANLLRRVFVDNKNDLFFGYELLVERAAEARYFWVTVRALGDEYLRELAARPAFRGLHLHPSYSATAFPAGARFLRDGDTFALDVLRNPRTGAKIVDIVRVSLSDPSQRQSAAEQPRDFAPDSVQLKVSDYTLKVNGETVYRSTGGCAGPLVWFSLGDRGRFVFSLVERPGYDFRKVGAARGNVVSFEWDGDKYEWESSQAVVGAGGNWNLWVMHDPDYRVDLFDEPTAPPAAADNNKSFEQKTDDAVRRMRQRDTQAEYGSADPARTSQTPRRTRRTRVVIGSADGVENLFPRQQK